MVGADTKHFDFLFVIAFFVFVFMLIQLYFDPNMRFFFVAFIVGRAHHVVVRVIWDNFAKHWGLTAYQVISTFVVG